jgi:hypothetical protein
MLSINAYASPPTAIQMQLMQNRVIKGANVEPLVVSVCDALMDMKVTARCNGVTRLGYINKYSNNALDLKKAIDSATFEFIAISTVNCGRQPCDQTATIKLNRLDDKSFKINIKIIDGQKANSDTEAYKKYFDAIGNSLFLNKAGVELGAISE